jgi:hypothetical protein
MFKYNKKKIFFISFAAIFLTSGYFIIFPIAVDYLNWQKVKMEINAAGNGFPYQVGLKKILVNKCELREGGACVVNNDPSGQGTPMCNTKGLLRCGLYSHVSSFIIAGGNGNAIVLPDIAIAKIGAIPGADLIAGCMSPVLCENGVAASWGGSYSGGIVKRIESLISDFIIAGK